MTMNQTSLFNHEYFKNWQTLVTKNGGKFSGRIVFPSGHSYHVGDPKIELQYWENEVQKIKRKSLDSIREPTTLKKLETPFCEIKQKQATYDAPFVVRHFIGDNGRYGEGECFFWEHKLPLDSLQYTKSIVTKVMKDIEFISVSDIMIHFPNSI